MRNPLGAAQGHYCRKKSPLKGDVTDGITGAIMDNNEFMQPMNIPIVFVLDLGHNIFSMPQTSLFLNAPCIEADSFILSLKQGTGTRGLYCSFDMELGDAQDRLTGHSKQLRVRLVWSYKKYPHQKPGTPEQGDAQWDVLRRGGRQPATCVPSEKVPHKLTRRSPTAASTTTGKPRLQQEQYRQ